MRLEVGRIHHHRLLNVRLGGKALHHPGESALVIRPLPEMVEGFRRAILPWRIAPPQAITTYEDNATQSATINDARPAMALGKEGLQSRHLLIDQPE